MSPMPVRRSLGVVVLAIGLASTAACTQDDGAAAPPESPSPSPTTASPTPTEPVELTLGEPVSFTLRGAGESSRVRLAVTDVTKGRIKDLSDFRLDAEGKESTPYYATVRVTNKGTGNLSGAQVTLWGFDSEGTVRPPAEVIGTFPRCQRRRLPKGFTKGESARTCLIYLLPEGTALEAVQYRFNDRPPYSWPVG